MLSRKDIPILLNGFSTGFLLTFSNYSLIGITAYIIALITFFWYGDNRYNNGKEENLKKD